ncbi:MAG: ferrous iron transport protein A [Spirochaetales bacterium]|nr:ferrous iron transport protein A [Spirochaetales bacterium]
MKSLDRLLKGQQGVIAYLTGGRKFLSRITAMGFTPDVMVSVVRNGGRGPIIASLRDTEVALGRGEAAKIMIKGDSCE